MQAKPFEPKSSRKTQTSQLPNFIPSQICGNQRNLRIKTPVLRFSVEEPVALAVSSLAVDDICDIGGRGLCVLQ